MHTTTKLGHFYEASLGNQVEGCSFIMHRALQKK